MNTLEQFICETGENEVKIMNQLTEKGLISDNCVRACDVAEADCQRAIRGIE